MKKLIIVIASVSVFIGAMALAKVVSTWSVVDKLEVGTGTVYKTYDENNEIVCYVMFAYEKGGISCLKNQ